MQNRVRGPAVHVTRRPAVNTVAAQRTRHLDLDPEGRRRREPSVARNASIRSHLERGYIRAETRSKPRPRPSGLREVIEHNLLQISAILLFVGSVGWCCFFYSQFRPATGRAPTSFAAYALTSFADADIGSEKSDVFNVSSYARSDGPQVELAAFPASSDAPAAKVLPASSHGSGNSSRRHAMPPRTA